MDGLLMKIIAGCPWNAHISWPLTGRERISKTPRYNFLTLTNIIIVIIYCFNNIRDFNIICYLFIK